MEIIFLRLAVAPQLSSRRPNLHFAWQLAVMLHSGGCSLQGNGCRKRDCSQTWSAVARTTFHLATDFLIPSRRFPYSSTFRRPRARLRIWVALPKKMEPFLDG